FYAFDPQRRAVVLCGGDKSNQKRFYETCIRLADEAFSRHLLSVEKTKLKHCRMSSRKCRQNGASG
ncbi:type II toxin-antitoxin system RelE/ParE family toxin, partial [Cronobacter sakazakii]|uniref:type II toxin-antitoxin system RelE/ParE family toxin n=1 Tax=Cronobacter sakazakii TaxID=28141 RepID=UPI002895F71B